MADRLAPIPKAIRVVRDMDEELGRQFIKLALMDPNELKNHDGTALTIAQFRAKFPDFDGLLDFTDFAGEEENHAMIFHQGSEAEHHFVLPSLNKLVPMIEGFLQESLDKYISANDMREDLASSRPFPTNQVQFPGVGYNLAAFYADVFLPAGAAPLSTESAKFFHMVVADYAHKGCRG